MLREGFFFKAARSKIWFGSSVPVQVLTCDGTGPARWGLYKAQAPTLGSPFRETKLPDLRSIRLVGFLLVVVRSADMEHCPRRY